MMLKVPLKAKQPTNHHRHH